MYHIVLFIKNRNRNRRHLRPKDFHDLIFHKMDFTDSELSLIETHKRNLISALKDLEPFATLKIGTIFSKELIQRIRTSGMLEILISGKDFRRARDVTRDVRTDRVRNRSLTPENLRKIKEDRSSTIDNYFDSFDRAKSGKSKEADTKERDNETKSPQRGKSPDSLPKSQGTKKKAIPKVLRISVWDRYIGKDKRSILCLVCSANKIDCMQGWEAGHVIPESKGGETVIENLRPICSMCNRSMGNMDMRDFCKKYYPDSYKVLFKSSKSDST